MINFRGVGPTEVQSSPPASSAQKEVAKPAALPMHSANPGSGRAEKALAPETVALLKAQVDQAQTESKRAKKTEPKAKAKAKVGTTKHTETDPDPKLEKLKKRITGSEAARRFIDSLATPAGKPSSSSSKRPDSRKKAKGKAKSAPKRKARKTLTKKAWCGVRLTD